MRHPAAQIVAYLKADMEKRSEHVRVGPFLMRFDPDSDNRFRNYALPLDDAQPTQQEVCALIAAFKERQRAPRLEFVADLAPAVWPALLAAGFTQEASLQLMMLGAAGLIRPAETPDFTFEIVTAQADLADVARVQNDAYGEPLTTPADVMRLGTLVERGGAVAITRSTRTGEALGAGLYSAPWHDITEIAAVGVRAADRRRGIGSRIVAGLTEHALCRGLHSPFLMAAREDEARVYARVGFVTCARMLHAMNDAKNTS
ncbi:MAG TPA: GNAT family N-acetyltransferase [Polyangiales bacterium]|nr:GNAT family N-acetyltransferase [Polyangiales bacterium]